MSEPIPFDDAIYLVWRNLPTSASTFGPCACGRGEGRGCGPCLKCAEEALAEHIGKDLAYHFVQHVLIVRDLENQMREIHRTGKPPHGSSENLNKS